ncbi:MAG: AAA family ATPase, partial [Phycisphaerae bacterium]|nr:AAA family ATPase [Phycisphaerae bacterium]
MLIEFRVSNLRSFRDEQVLSLVAGSGNELPGNCMDVGGNQLVRTAAIYGPNASGKSNLIDALGFMAALIKKSTEMEGAKAFRSFPFLLDSRSKERPTVLEVTFLLEEVRHQYGFSIAKGRIHDEWLIAYPKGKAQRWFERSFDPKKEEYTWKWSTFFKGQKDRLAEMTRPTTLFLSAGAQFNHPQLSPVHTWLTTNVRVLSVQSSLRPVTA